MNLIRINLMERSHRLPVMAGLSLLVIPGRDEVASPESIAPPSPRPDGFRARRYASPRNDGGGCAAPKTRLAAVTFAILLTGVSAASAASITGSSALALAGVVAPSSPLLTPAEKNAVAALFSGKTDVPYAKKISITADKIVCRIGNVDITARSCELTFGTTKRTFAGREAGELYATQALAGVPSDGAAGSVSESLLKLNCTLDPAQIKQKAGAGAECSYGPAN
jgi:hypothetical protein